MRSWKIVNALEILKVGVNASKKATRVRKCDRPSVANMVAIMYTQLVAVERHDHIQFSLHVEVMMYIRYYNIKSIDYIRLLKYVYSFKDISK